MASLGSRRADDRTRDRDAEVSAFVADLARWSTAAKTEDQAFFAEPQLIRPREDVARAPIRGTKRTTVEHARDGDFTKKTSTDPEDFDRPAEVERRFTGDGFGGSFAEAVKRDAKEMDLSTRGRSKKDIEKMLFAMRSAPPREKTWAATREKEKGNEFFKAREYRSAVEAYDVSIALDGTNPAVFANRAAAHMKLKRWSDAVRDCDAALALDPKHFKARLRRGASLLERGEAEAAAEALVEFRMCAEIRTSLLLGDAAKAAAAEADPELDRLTARAEKLVAAAEEKRARASARRVAIEETPETPGKTDASVSRDSPSRDATETTAFARRGPMVIEEIVEEQEVSPGECFREKTTRTIVAEEDSESDDEKSAEETVSKKNQGNLFFANGEYARAIESYDEALSLAEKRLATGIDGANADASVSIAVLFANRAASNLKLARFPRAEEDASRAIEADASYVKGYHRRAVARASQHKFELALEDYEKVVRANPRCSALQREVNACMEKAAEAMLRGAATGSGSLGDPGDAPSGSGFRPTDKKRTVIIEPDSDDDSSEEDVMPTRKPAIEACAATRSRRETDCVGAGSLETNENENENDASREGELEEAPKRVGRSVVPEEAPKRTRSVAIVEEDSCSEDDASDAEAKCSTPDRAERSRAAALAAKERGNAFFKSGAFQKAETAYSEALSLDPSEAAYRANRAAARLKLGNTRGALEDADAALVADPTHARARHRRAVALSLLGRDEEAAEEYARVTAAHPGHSGIAAEAAEARRKLERAEETSSAMPERNATELSDDPARDARDEPLPAALAPETARGSWKPKEPKELKKLKKPKTSVEFERGCKSLRSDPASCLAFLRSVSDAELPDLIKHSMSAVMLGAYCVAFEFAASDAGPGASEEELRSVADTATRVSSLPRFGIHAALLKPEERKRVRNAFDALGEKCSKETRKAWGA